MSSTQSQVSIIIPCYRQAHYLKECLTSVLDQTYPHWQAIVIDDHSPDHDKTLAIVAELADPRIRVVRHERNRGLAASRNTGIREATTDFFVTLDADDKLDPRFLEHLVPVLSADDELDCAFPNVQMFGREQGSFTYPGPVNVLQRQGLPGAGPLMRRRLWERAGGYDEADMLRHGREDREFYIRAFSNGATAQRVSDAVYLYRTSHSSMTTLCHFHEHEVIRYIYDKHRALFDAAGEGGRFLAKGYNLAARAWYKKGSRTKAFFLALQAWRHDKTRGRLEAVARTLRPQAMVERAERGEARRLSPFRFPLRGADRHRPLFIIGVARSGNTLFRRVLTSHSQIHIPPETFVLRTCFEKYRRYGRRMNWPDMVHLIMSQFEYHPEFGTFEISLRPLVQELIKLPRGKRNLACLLDAFYRYHGEQHGETVVRWGDKSPLNSLRPGTLQRLVKVFPDAQFVHIYRDGVDVVYSHLSGGFYRDVHDAANRYKQVIRQTKAFVQSHAGQSFEIRYEDLLGQPEPTVRSVCQFLGVDFEPTMLQSEKTASALGDVPEWYWHQQVHEPINPKNPGKGRSNFSAAEKAQIDQIMGDELTSLGYPRASAGGPDQA